MKAVTRPDQIFLYNGALVKVVGIINDRAIIMRFIQTKDMPKCEHCGAPLDQEFVVVENSRLFQERAIPVNTLEEK